MTPGLSALVPLCIAGILAGPVLAEESRPPLGGGLAGTTLGGYVDTSAVFGPAASVPEPDTAALAGVGVVLLIIAGARTRRR